MNIDKKTIKRIFFVIVGCIFVYWVLHDSSRVSKVFSDIIGVLSPFIIGGCIAFVLNVPMRAFVRLFKKIKHRTIRRVVSLVATFISVLLVLFVVFLLLIPQLVSAISSLVPSVKLFLQDAEAYLTTLINANRVNLGSDALSFEGLNWSNIAEQAMGVLGTSVETIVYGLFDIIAIILGGVFDAFIAIVFAVYALFQKETLCRQGRKLLYAFIPERIADKTIEIVLLSCETFSNFLSGQCTEVCILGGLFAIFMAIFQMPYIALISVLVAITAFIPVVGSWIGCVFGAFFIFVNDMHNPMQAVWFVIMFVILQQIENNMIYPRVVGSSIGLSGMWVLMAVGVGGALFGIAGMFIMIPITSVVYTVLRDVANKRLSDRGIDEKKLRPENEYVIDKE